MHSDQFKPKSYLKLIKKYVFSEGEQFSLTYLTLSSRQNYQKPRTYAMKLGELNTSHAPMGGAESAPPVFFQNNSKTVADISTKFGIPYPTSIWHQMTKFGRNRSEKFWEIDVFVGSLHANFYQNRLNVKKFAKNRYLKQTEQKDQYRCTMTRSTKWLSRNFKIFRFWPQNFEEPIFLENLYKVLNF